MILILADGMRPDALAEIPTAQKCIQRTSYTLKGQTVFPSITLPCHMSLFHSVDPDRHGTTTNIYAHQVRPIDGLFDVLHKSDKKCAMFYDWEELRDLARPGALTKSYLFSQYSYGYENTNRMVTAVVIESLRTERLDFMFVYLSAPDCTGHDHSRMSGGYMQSLESVWKNIDRLLDVVTEDDFIMVTADHGGHGRSHGTLMPENMENSHLRDRTRYTPGERITGLYFERYRTDHM